MLFTIVRLFCSTFIVSLLLLDSWLRSFHTFVMSDSVTISSNDSQISTGQGNSGRLYLSSFESCVYQCCNVSSVVYSLVTFIGLLIYMVQIVLIISVL